MFDQVLSIAPGTVAAPATLIAEPFLHYGPDRIYNTLTDRFLSASDPGFNELHRLRNAEVSPSDVSENLLRALVTDGWLIESGSDVGARFRLKYVSFEASTVCNQGCYFCPVSVDRREEHSMSMELYERIAAQLSEHRATIDGVSMIHYNEPTADKRFLEQVRVLKRYGLPPAVLTNATGGTAAIAPATISPSCCGISNTSKTNPLPRKWTSPSSAKATLSIAWISSRSASISRTPDSRFTSTR
jgi:hypothetical protein